MQLIISPALAELRRINTRDLFDLQGNLKDLDVTNYNRLKASISANGFIIPLFVWFNPLEDGKPYTLDGNQRLRFFRREYPEGIDLPFIEVEAADKSDAKKKILLISSQYGQTTKDGFDAFIADVEDAQSFLGEMTTFSNFLDMEPEPEPAEKAEANVPFSAELDEESNYVVLQFKTKLDWLQFTSRIQLESVASTQTNGLQRSVGPGRVLDGSSTLDLLDQTAH